MLVEGKNLRGPFFVTQLLEMVYLQVIKHARKSL